MEIITILRRKRHCITTQPNFGILLLLKGSFREFRFFTRSKINLYIMQIVHCFIFSSATDGVYNLQLNKTSEVYQAYCHMSNLSSQCGGGGWTLVMKLDRKKVK